ncbi:MAG: hybrid sensor histidine kinase/response regulator [Bacteroidales bacterium]|nr:hybrid sensor histidine kinase/response regulator [Bacteroidales bacterium]MBN2818772.1 hybrid sensor histidine kinase/response regulator [Bacteroidales bacterium]
MSVEKIASVLVVDDIESNIEFVTDVLEMENMNIYAASNGEDAIALSKEKLPDLILLDISMPGIDGYQVCRVLKKDKSTAHIPVIFLTARIQKEDIIKGFELGAVDYITKPFNFNELISRVNTHIELKQKTEQLEKVNQELEEIVEERTIQVKKAFSELQVTNKKLTEANQKLAKLDKAKTDFILHINHELRTPLNGILGYVSLLSEAINDAQNNEQLKAIECLTRRLIKVAELSLLFTELKVRDEQLDFQKIDLNVILNEAIEKCSFNEKNIEIEIDNPYHELWFENEPKLLQSCLTIVIDNAIKYSPANNYIQITVKKNAEQIEMIISDNGPGFSEKSLEQLFNFFTADNLNYQSHGFGIGLATAKIILDVINADIMVENKTPSGAKVTLTFSPTSETKPSRG